MATWLYQLSANRWSPERYRADVWEGERWRYSVGRTVGGGETPKPGDTVVFFYAKHENTDPGFYGWGVLLDGHEPTETLSFRPTAPSDFLKMTPWWDEEADRLADTIRGNVPLATLFLVKDEDARKLRAGIIAWLARAKASETA
jgi:hypothetical protein